ncbi:TIM barrel protein [Brachybacterium sp. GCM10030267]|uniref:TIM barrel protein n=1 Tax=unclassified Brachybacterium TaxID=2623841 RepID=UPI0036242775
MDARDLSLNCSLSLQSTPLRERAARARDLGFEAVEFWWPFAAQHPDESEIAAFVDSIRRAEVELVLLNFPGGGPSVDDRGLLCVPGREDDFARAAETAIGVGRRLGVRRYNPMAGNLAEPGPPTPEEFETALHNLVRIAPMVAASGARIVLEPLSGFARAALTSFADARTLAVEARGAGAADVDVLLDIYHAAVQRDAVLEGGMPDPALIGHVQVADAPGRGWPGTGELPLRTWLHDLRRRGYQGRIGIECSGEQPLLAREVASRL